jgi:UDP-N-acetylglucosamine acyltransferase
MSIHPTAIISPKAELDASVEVGPHAIIDAHVRIGAGTRVWANAYLTGHTEIGRDNEIHMGAVVGHEPQDLKFDRNCVSHLKIGDGNVIREYCTIHRGTEPGSSTVIGDRCFLMGASHIAHNCHVGSQVIMCNAALLAGHVHVGDRAFISGGVTVHQFIQIGRLAIISGNARITMDVPPFLMISERNVVHGLNLVGLKRAKISADALAEIKKLYKLFYRAGLSTSHALRQAEAEGIHQTAEGREFVEFVRASPNGICFGARQ